MAIQSIIFIFFAFLYNFVIVLKIFKRIGYVQIKIIKIGFLSIIDSIAIMAVCVDPPQKIVLQSLINTNLIKYISIWILLSIFIFFVLYLIQLKVDYHSPKHVFKYLHISVKNNNIDNCIWCACTSGQLIKIITKSNEEFIVFPKYSSSYDCKLPNKKHLRVFILKKGKVNCYGKFEYYEDNTRLILQNADLLVRRKNDHNSLFEEIKTDSSENKKPHYHPYLKVPFYQILSEFEDRIDFKDIASISIYHPEGNNHD